MATLTRDITGGKRPQGPPRGTEGTTATSLHGPELVSRSWKIQSLNSLVKSSSRTTTRHTPATRPDLANTCTSILATLGMALPTTSLPGSSSDLIKGVENPWAMLYNLKTKLEAVSENINQNLNYSYSIRTSSHGSERQIISQYFSVSLLYV